MHHAAADGTVVYRLAVQNWAPALARSLRHINRDAPMTAMTSLLSPAYQTFLNEAPKHAQAWAQCVQGLSGASALDKKTESLAYLAVLAALRLESGIPFHVVMARNAGATREEVVSAVLVGLPAVGNACTTALPVALRAFDQTEGPDAR